MLVLFEEQTVGMAGVERTKWRIKKVMQNHSYRVGQVMVRALNVSVTEMGSYSLDMIRLNVLPTSSYFNLEVRLEKVYCNNQGKR